MSTHSDSLEIDDIELIEQFLVDEPSSSPNSTRSYNPKSQTVEPEPAGAKIASTSLDSSTSTRNFSRARLAIPNNAAENGVFYKDTKGNLYRVVSDPSIYQDSTHEIERITVKKPPLTTNDEINSSYEKGHGLHPLKAFYLQVGEHRLRFRVTAATGRDAMKCAACKLAFTTRASFLKHNLQLHPEATFHCPTCPRIFTQQNTLDEHKLIHNMKPRYNCHLCPKRFVHRSNLLIHLKLHSTDKSNFCPDCDKWFNDQGVMLTHNVYCSARLRKLEPSERAEAQNSQRLPSESKPAITVTKQNAS